jgi:hypothetical protein
MNIHVLHGSWCHSAGTVRCSNVQALSHPTAFQLPVLLPQMSAVSAPFMRVHLFHNHQPSSRTLQDAYASGPLLVLGKGAVSYKRGTPVRLSQGRGQFLLSELPLYGGPNGNRFPNGNR